MIIWLCPLHPWTTCGMLQQCQKLLWLHCINCSSAISLLVGCSKHRCTKYGLHHPWHATPYLFYLWWFYPITRKATMGCPNCRDRPRKWCWSTDLGGSKLSTFPDFDLRWFHCTDYLPNFGTQSWISGIWVCRWCQLVYNRTETNWKHSHSTHASISHNMGRITTCHGQHPSPWQMLLAFHTQPLGKEYLAICTTKTGE